MGALLPFARRLAPAALLAVTAAVGAPRDAAAQDRTPPRLRFEVRYASDLHAGPLTGRLFLAFSPTAEPEPRIAAYNSARQRDGRVPFFAAEHIAGNAPAGAPNDWFTAP